MVRKRHHVNIYTHICGVRNTECNACLIDIILHDNEGEPVHKENLNNAIIN